MFSWQSSPRICFRARLIYRVTHRILCLIVGCTAIRSLSGMSYSDSPFETRTVRIRWHFSYKACWCDLGITCLFVLFRSSVCYLYIFTIVMKQVYLMPFCRSYITTIITIPQECCALRQFSSSSLFPSLSMLEWHWRLQWNDSDSWRKCWKWVVACSPIHRSIVVKNARFQADADQLYAIEEQEFSARNLFSILSAVESSELTSISLECKEVRL